MKTNVKATIQIYHVKKAEISNNILVVLMLVAIAMSVIGTYASISRPGSIAGQKIIGYAPSSDSAVGEVNLSVDQILDINFTTASLDWGTGSIVTGESNCTLNTNGSGNRDSCSGFNSQPNSPLAIENIGNVNVSLNLSFSANSSIFIGGTSSAFYFWWNYTAGSCANSTGNVYGSTEGTTTSTDDESWWGSNSVPSYSWIEVNDSLTNAYALCKIFSYAENNDDVFLYFYATLPQDCYTGNLTETVTATGYLVEGQ